MSVLVLGGAGYIGSHTVYELVDRDEDVVIADNLQTGYMEAVHPNARFYEGDIRDENFLNALFNEEKIDSVIHFAANSLVGESMTDPLKYYDNNLYGTMVLLKSMVKNGINKIVFSSTAAVYGEPEYTPIDELHPLKPVNPYGMSKFFTENILSSFDASYNVRHVALRYFNACGAWGGSGEKHNPETHLIPLILQVPLGKREKIYINGTDYNTKDGTCVRDYIHVYDLARAHYLALNYLRAGGRSEKINLGTGKGFSIKEVIEVCEKVAGKEINMEIRGRRAGDPAVLIASNKKAKDILGWDIKYNDLYDIVKSAYLFHKNN